MYKYVRNLIILSFFITTVHSFSLKDGFKLALENDMDYKVNQNNLKNIKIDQDIANALMYPSVDFSANIEASKLTQGKLTPDSTPFAKSDEYKLTLTQPVFDGFESDYEKKLQKEKFKSALFYLKDSQESLALNYSTAYINVLKEKDLLNLSKESLQISEEIFNKVQKKVNAGYGTKLEFEEAKGNFAENKVNLNIQKINLKEAIENLRLYVQSDFDSSELENPSFNTQLPKNLKEAEKLAFSENPAINVAKANVIVAEFEHKKSNKDYYPNVNFVSSYNVNNAIYKENDEEYNEYKLGFEINYNLFNGGKDNLAEKKAIQNVKDKELLVKKSEYQVKNSLRLAWSNYNLGKEKEENLKQYLLVKKDVLDATIKEFDLGLKELNTLLDTHVEYIDVKKDLISNTYNLTLTQYKILNSLGLLTESLDDKLPTLEKYKKDELVQDLQDDLKYTYNDNDKKKSKIIKASFEEPKVYKNDIVINIPSSSILKSENSSFKDKFLSANKNKYTINLAYTNSEIGAENIIKQNDLSEDAFYFSFGYENPLQKIMYGVFDSKQEAKNALTSLPSSLKKNMPRVEKISIKQNLYAKYHGNYDKNQINKFDTNNKIADKNIDNKVIIRKVSYSVTENEALSSKIGDSKNTFKDVFLNAAEDKYTINLAYTKSINRAQWILDNYNISNNAFYFTFGKEEPLQKIMYGVFNTKEEAINSLNSLPESLKSNRPRVEKVSIKQKLYNKYNNTYSSALGSI